MTDTRLSLACLQINAICATARSDPASALNRVTAAETLVEIRIRKADLLRAFPELTRSPFPPYEAEVVLEEAEEYRRRIKYGKLGVLDDLAYFERRRAKRLEFGDLLWCLAFEVRALALPPAFLPYPSYC